MHKRAGKLDPNTWGPKKEVKEILSKLSLNIALVLHKPAKNYNHCWTKDSLRASTCIFSMLCPGRGCVILCVFRDSEIFYKQA